MPEQVSDYVTIRDTSQARLSVSTSAAQTSAITVAGIYDLWTDVDTYVKIGTTANDVTTTTGYLLRSGNTVAFSVGLGDKIGGITASGSGTLSYQKVG